MAQPPPEASEDTKDTAEGRQRHQQLQLLQQLQLQPFGISFNDGSTASTSFVWRVQGEKCVFFTYDIA